MKRLIGLALVIVLVLTATTFYDEAQRALSRAVRTVRTLEKCVFALACGCSGLIRLGCPAPTPTLSAQPANQFRNRHESDQRV